MHLWKKDIRELSEEEKCYYDKIFRYYDSDIIDKYFEESKQKTDKLEHRIVSYVKKYGNTPDVRKRMAKRLSCVRSHINNVIKD
jgi:succinate dehydrogenase flavin-adding protein (antitoxin of CptAB toxin-antitoxin module)